MMATERRIAIACGGTAGHIYPALAFADAYRESHPDAELLFIGTPEGFESVLVRARGYRLELISGRPLAREPVTGKLRAIGSLLGGVAAARRLLKQNRIQFVIGFGGYATAGTIIAARSLGLKIAVHEANVDCGMTNRWLARLADRVYVAFERTQAVFPQSRVVVTGNPVRREIIDLAEKRRRTPSRRESRVRFFITGGSGGSNFLNREVPGFLSQIAAQGIVPEALHQAGAFPLAPIREAYARCGVAATVSDYIKDMDGAYEWADFVIACAGAQTLAELSVCALPCLIVPLSAAAAGHQVANAIAFTEAGAAMWTREETWDAASLAVRIAGMLRDHRSVGGPAVAPRETDAARKMIADLDALMHGA
jgi:UDP-N-acetylglucosamine--N-acetylmuramyl-(pentapeptide) pyrophosphoryl-undecaprenol N-acetylglucosamine transferase